MADPFDTDHRSSFGPEAARAKDDLNHRFQDLRREAEASARSASDSVEARFRQGGGASTPDEASSSFRRQASQAADEARDAASSFAEQARARLGDVIGAQKAAGADKIAGVAQAARSAAGDLDRTSPQMARIVRTAAENVDRIADDVRSRDIGDVLASVAEFGRRQPVAFFGGALVAGFMLARFFKSDAPLVDDSAFSGGPSA